MLHLLADRPTSDPRAGLVIRRSGVSAAIAAALLLALTTMAMAANWTDADDLSLAGQSADGARAAVDSSGNALVVWERSDGTNKRIQARVRFSTGALSAVQTLSPSGEDAYTPQVAGGSSGNAVVVWERFDGTNYRVQARARSSAGALSAVQTLSPSGGDAYNVQVALDSSGNAIVVWNRFDGTKNRIQAVVRSSTGTLSAVQTLSSAGQNGDQPQVAVDSSGNAVVVWRRFDGTNYRIQARARSSAGALSAVQKLSASGQTAFAPDIAEDPSGNAVVVWQRSDGANYRIQARARSSAGALDAVQNLSASGQDAYWPDIAVDSSGILAVWYRNDGVNWRIQARTRSSTGTLGAVQTVSAAGVNSYRPDVAVNSTGDAAVVWPREDGGFIRIEISVRSST
jgi:hypothetical protein